jgi:hypothetical protein
VGTGGAGTAGNGASGQNGYAAIVFRSTKVYVKDGSNWQSANTVWINAGGIWQQIQQIWIKQGGIWYPTAGGTGPVFATTSGLFGVSARTGPQYVPPVMMGTMSDIF